MVKNLFIFVFLAWPAFSFALEPVLDPNSQVVDYADLKGNGLKEKVILNGNPYNHMGGYFFKSLKIFEEVRLVYSLDSRDGFDQVTVENYVVAPLRKGRKFQILILLRGSDAAESTLKIIEWNGQKYVETLAEHCRTADVRDLEKNGNFQMILGQKSQIPHLYDYDSRLGKYMVSDKKHLEFFRELIKEYESEMAEYQDDSSWLVKLAEIIDAAKMAGDSPKVEEAERRLAELRDKMAQKSAAPLGDASERTKP